MIKIVLVGYMAVGKSTIAELMSKKTGIKALDLDRLIEKESQLSIDEIFEQQGELYFRKLESAIFKEILKRDELLIISTGGGTPCYADNHLLLKQENVTSIYLKLSIDGIFERLKRGKAKRPLVASQSEEELKEFIAKHLFERSYFYNQAKHTITLDNKRPEEVVDEILTLLH